MIDEETVRTANALQEQLRKYLNDEGFGWLELTYNAYADGLILFELSPRVRTVFSSFKDRRMMSRASPDAYFNSLKAEAKNAAMLLEGHLKDG